MTATIPQNFVELALDDGPTEPEPTWTDFTKRVKAISFASAGRQQDREDVAGGSLRVLFRDDDRVLDPRNLAGPYFGKLKPMKRIRWRWPNSGYAIADVTATLSGNEITDELRETGTTGDGRPRRVTSNDFDVTQLGQTTLSAGVNSSVTTLPITAWQEEWPGNSAFRIMVDQETMIVTGGFGTTSLTVVRGVAQAWGTAQAAAAHSDGATVTTAFSPPDVWEFKAASLGGKFADQAQLVTTPAGHRALKMIVHPGDQNDAADATRERIEGNFTAAGDTGEMHFYGFSNEYPADFAANNFGCFIGQIGPNHNSGTAAVYLRVNSNDVFELGFNAGVLNVSTFVGTNTTAYQFNDVPVSKSVRHDFIVGIEWKLTATGRLVLYHREEGQPWRRLLNLSGIVTSSSLSGVTPAIKRKHGIYRNAHATATNYLYLSNVRQATSWEDVQFEDPPAHDSSIGIWPAATNLLTAALNQGGGTAATVDDADYQFMGAAMQLSTFDAVNDNAFRTFSGLTIGNVYTDSIWVDREEIDARFLKLQIRNAANSATVAEVNVPRKKGLQRVQITWTAAETSGRVRLICTDATNLPIRVWHGRPQLETGAIATPFAGFGTRAASRAQLPSTGWSATQGWAAMLVRTGWAAGDPTATGGNVLELFNWRASATEQILAYWDDAAQVWKFNRVHSGSGTSASASAPLPRVGSLALVVVAWTATQVKISVNGSAFVTASNSVIPTGLPATIDVGSLGGSSEFLRGSVKWFTWGFGTLTDADASSLFDAYVIGLGEPAPTNLVWASAANVQGMWSAETETYVVKSDLIRFQGFINSFPPTWGVRRTEVEIQASDAFKALSLFPLPKSNPDFTDYNDVVSARKPGFFFLLNEQAGTKVAHHVRKRKRREHETRRHYRKHGIHHWKTRVTRFDADGMTGPPGVYKNTPQLAQPGLIIGEPDFSTRFRRAQAEHVIIPLDDADDSPQGSLTLEAWISPDSIVTSGSGNRNAIWSGPPLSFGSNLHAFMLYISSDVLIGDFPDVGGFNPFPSVTQAWVPGRIYYVAVTVDESLEATAVVGDVTNETFTVGTPVSLASVGALITTPYRLKIGGADDSAYYFDGRIAKAAIYQRGLSPNGALADHFESGAFRGFAQHASGTRISEILDLVGAWTGSGGGGGAPAPAQSGFKGLRVDSQLSLANLQTTLDDAVAMGAEIIRFSAFWDNIETSDNVYNWTKHDNVVAECQARGLKIVFHIAQTPTWAVAGGGWTPPTTTTQLNQWKSFLQTMAARYGTDVDLYEIWNEPNGASFWNSASAQSAWPAEYAKVLRYAHDGLKAGNAAVRISAMNTNRGLVSGYMNEVYDALEADVGIPTCQANNYYFDVLSVHPYALTHSPSFAAGGDDIADAWGGVIGRSFLDYRRARDLVHTREGVWKDVYLGEFGYNTDGSSNNGPVADATRATYVQMAFDAIRADGFVIGLSWYAWKQATSAWDIDGTLTGAAFAAVDPAPPVASSPEPTPLRLLDAGRRQVQPVRQGGQLALSEIAETVAAEDGLFTVRDNRFIFLDSDYRDRWPYSQISATFADDPFDDEYLALAPEPSYDESRLVTSVSGSMLGSEDTQVVTDAVAEGEYLPREDDLGDLICVSDADVLAIVQDRLARSKDAEYRIESLTIEPFRDARLWNQVLARGFQDRILFVRRGIEVGTAFAQDSRIEHVEDELDLRSETPSWRTTWRLSPA